MLNIISQSHLHAQKDSTCAQMVSASTGHSDVTYSLTVGTRVTNCTVVSFEASHFILKRE